MKNLPHAPSRSFVSLQVALASEEIAGQLVSVDYAPDPDPVVALDDPVVARATS
ncbi:hypothetical protein LCGC14_3082970, partial [marine sediment metagenome]